MGEIFEYLFENRLNDSWQESHGDNQENMTVPPLPVPL